MDSSVAFGACVPLRVLYLPLEGYLGDQVAPRAAFEKLQSDGRIEGYECFSFLAVARESGNWDLMLQKLLEVAQRFQPNLIYWELQTSGRVPSGFVESLRKLESHPVIVQRTGDSYWSPPKKMVEFGRLIDATFITSTTLISQFENSGCKNVFFLPERLDTVRFGKAYPPSAARRFDVVMIANYYNDLGFKKFPGQKLRRQLVEVFHKAFGDRFGIFGKGWEGLRCLQGVIPYEDQQEVMRDSYLVLGSNNWNHSDYFSDRYLISISSGIPVLYSRFEGCERFFTTGKECWYFASPEDALNQARRILSMDINQREEISRTAAAKAILNFSCLKQAEELLDIFQKLQSQS